MQEIVGGRELWPRITTLMNSARRRRVAIAYVSSAKLLPLGPGDQLIIDASVDRIVSGATDPNALLKWIRLGVEVWSCATLHAKVVVTDTHTVISSANASVNAGEHLEEAAVLTDDRYVHRSTVDLLDRWITQSTRLKVSDLTDLIPLFGLERVAGRPTLWESIVPRPLQRMMFISTYAGSRTPADVEHSQKVIAGRTATVDRLTLEWVEVPPADEFAKGQLVCQVQQGVGVWAPQQVVYVLEVRRQKWLGLLTEPDLEPTSRNALRQDTGLTARVNQWIYEPADIGAVLDHWDLRS